MSSSSTNNAIYGVDFTLKVTDYENVLMVKKELSKWCKKWVFQKEVGEGGYIHYQGRVSLKKKARINSLFNKFLPGAHLSPTTNTEFSRDSFDYVMKEQSRVDGPWMDTDEPDAPMTRQLNTFLGRTMYPWQEDLMEMCKEEDDRSIKIIYDKIGNIGKSIFCEYLEYNKLAFEIPPMNNMEDIMQMCMCVPAQKCYLVDMPRALKKDKLGQFYSGLECLKNGYVYDKRYNFKKRRFDRPQVIVFTNVLPAFDLMSADRWEVFEVYHDHTMGKWYDEGH